MSAPRLVVVTMVMSTFAAEAARGALEAAGVPAVTKGEQHASWLFAGSGGGLGLVQVLVEEDRLAEAKAVLAELEQADDEAGSGGLDGDDSDRTADDGDRTGESGAPGDEDNAPGDEGEAG
jgi:hypothetical protein